MKPFEQWTREMKDDYGYDPDTMKYDDSWRRIQEDWLIY